MSIFHGEVLIEISQCADQEKINPRELGNGILEGDWYWYTDGDYRGALRFITKLYRGQNCRHYPMLPSIARGLEVTSNTMWEHSALDQAKIVLRLAQTWWFAREMKFHPISKHAKKNMMRLDSIALAQHYGIPTGYLDLTDDFNVAAFFATCSETKHGWEPVSSGTGIIYMADLSEAGMDTPIGRHKPLGPQPLPRPTEQSAWVTELPLIHSFEGWPGVKTLQFQQSKEVGEHFLARFNEGEALFPIDPLSEAAREILECGEIPDEILDASLNSFATDPHGIRSVDIADVIGELKRIVTKVAYRRILSDGVLQTLEEDVDWRAKMLPEIKAKVLVVRDEPNLVETSPGRKLGLLRLVPKEDRG